jgi:hypothetical protein
VTPVSSSFGRLLKPTRSTQFHIDYDWWQRADRELRVYLQSHLCTEHQAVYVASNSPDLVDWIDPDTAEVRRVDGLQHTLRSHCAGMPGYLTEHTSLVDAVFRVFLANGNQPLSPDELAERIHRSADTILRTLAGQRVYKGLRPYVPNGQ